MGAFVALLMLAIGFVLGVLYQWFKTQLHDAKPLEALTQRAMADIHQQRQWADEQLRQLQQRLAQQPGVNNGKAIMPVKKPEE